MQSLGYFLAPSIIPLISILFLVLVAYFVARGRKANSKSVFTTTPRKSILRREQILSERRLGSTMVFIGVLGLLLSIVVFSFAIENLSKQQRASVEAPTSAGSLTEKSHEVQKFIPMSTLGTFGDFVGGTLNPILSFLALLALLLTLAIQIRELKETRRELELSRRAHEKIAMSSEAADRLALTTAIYNRWSNLAMRKMRVSIYFWFKEKSSSEIPIKWSGLELERQIEILEIANVVNDIGRLQAMNLLDENFLRQVFLPHFYDWVSIFGKVDWDDAEISAMMRTTTLPTLDHLVSKTR